MKEAQGSQRGESNDVGHLDGVMWRGSPGGQVPSRRSMKVCACMFVTLFRGGPGGYFLGLASAGPGALLEMRRFSSAGPIRSGYANSSPSGTERSSGLLNQILVKIELIGEYCLDVHPFRGVKDFNADNLVFGSCIQIDAFRNLDNPVRLFIAQLDIYGIDLIVVMYSHLRSPLFKG
jgi:hypothetical protein